MNKNPTFAVAYMKVKFKLLSVPMLIVYVISAFALSAYSQTNIVNETEVNEAIEYMLNGLGQKVTIQPRIDKVVEYKESAVHLLTKKYKELKDEKCWSIISCLCKISSEQALEFVRQILREHKKRWSTSHAIRQYPIGREDDIIQLLIELMNVQYQRLDASERLKRMIMRKPSRAGFLVNALKDKKQLEECNYYLGEVLAWVSGYSHTWCVWVPPGQDTVTFRNAFWRNWWERNKDKEMFEWLLETMDTDNLSRKAQALQIMGILLDKRATSYFVAALDDTSDRVRYWAVIGLKKLNGTYPKSGYLWKNFKSEEKKIIDFLRNKFKTVENSYEEIEIREAYSKRIIRARADNIYSGQIKSQKGFSDFLNKYLLESELDFKTNFERNMLIFGITDKISTRAFQFLKSKANSYILDYYDTGIVYKLKHIGRDLKYSHIQIFKIDRIENISHIRVKNMVTGLSKVYE